MEFVLAIVILCGMGINRLRGEIGWRSFQAEQAARERAAREALDRPRREFYDQYTNNDYAETLEMVLRGRVSKRSPGYDPEVSEHFSKELRCAIRGTRYWQKIADSPENFGYATHILLAAHGYVDSRRTRSLEPLGRILSRHIAVGYQADDQEYPTEAYIELLELIEDLLHKNGVPHGWELFRDMYGNDAMTWGGSVLNERYRGKRGLSLTEVKRQIREAEAEHKRFVDLYERTHRRY